MPPGTTKLVSLSKPRGFCAGVIRATYRVEFALEALGPPVCGRQEFLRSARVAASAAGAPAPEWALQAEARHLQEAGFTRLREVGTIAGNAQFPVPQELRAAPFLARIASLP